MRRNITIYICVVLTGIEMSALFTWSYFRDPIASLFPSWSQSQLSLIFSLHNISVVIFALLTGVLIKYISPRIVLFFSAVMLLIGFGMMPFLPTDNPSGAYIMMLICFSLISASSAGFSGISAPTVYQPFLPDRLGLLTGIMFLTAGAAPMLLGFIASKLIQAFDVLQAMRIVGLICFGLIVVTMPFNKAPKTEVALPGAGGLEKAVPSYKEHTLTEVLKSPIFWCFFLFSAVARGTGIVLSDLGGIIAIAFGTTALLGLVVALSNGVASVLFGAVHDRFGLDITLYFGSGLLILSGVFLLIGNALTCLPIIILGLCLGGAGYGVSLVMGATGTRTLFGNKNYAQNYSIITLSIAFAALFGYVAGMIIDSMRGSYIGVFVLVLALGILSLLFVVLLSKSRKSRQRDEDEGESLKTERN